MQSMYDAARGHHFKADPNDFIILVMGPPGSGKTNFINRLTQNSERSANILRRSGQGVTPHIIMHNGVRIVLVDTPGFNDTYRPDSEILREVADWLTQKYPDGTTIKVAGMVYLHRITNNHMSGAVYKNLQMFGRLCGDIALPRARLVTTMWDRVKDQELAKRRETELKSDFWAKLLEEGAVARRFDNTGTCAWDIVRELIEPGKNGDVDKFLLQEELVEQQKRLNETEAGKLLYSWLRQLLVDQKKTLQELADEARLPNDPALVRSLQEEYDKLNVRFQKTSNEVEAMKIPLDRRIILSLFSGRKVPARRDGPQDEQPSTSKAHDNEAPNSTTHDNEAPDSNLNAHDNEVPDSTPEQPTAPSVSVAEKRSEVGDGDLLEAEGLVSAPTPLFDYDDTSSPVSSIQVHEVEVMPPSSSGEISQLPDALPVVSSLEVSPGEHPDPAESPGAIPMMQRWLRMMRRRRSKKSQRSHRSDQFSREPIRPPNPPLRSNPPARGSVANRGHSRMAAAQRRLRTVARNLEKEPQKQDQPETDAEATKAVDSNKDPSTGGQSHANTTTAGPAQQANNASQPPVVPTGVRVMQQAGDATLSVGCKIGLPVWMLCRCPVHEDGTH